MKKTKFLTPILGLTTATLAVLPLASCAIGSNVAHVTYNGSKKGTMTDHITLFFTLDKYYESNDIQIQIIGDETSTLYHRIEINDKVLALTIYTVSNNSLAYHLDIQISNNNNWTETVQDFVINFTASQMEINSEVNLDDLNTEGYPITIVDKETHKEITPQLKSSDEKIVKVVDGKLYPVAHGSAEITATWPRYEVTTIQVEVASFEFLESHTISGSETAVTVSGKSSTLATRDKVYIPSKWNVDGQWRTVTGLYNSDTSTGAFKDFTNFNEIYFPSCLEHLGTNAFENCTNLKTIDLSTTQVKKIEDYDFYNCNALATVNLPDNATELARGAFQIENGTGLLKTITLPSKLTTIGWDCFKNQALETITIPQNVVSIGADAFKSCNDLCEVITDSKYAANLIEWGTLRTGDCTCLYGEDGDTPNYRATSVFVKEGISIRAGAFIDMNYNLESSSVKKGYNQYTINTAKQMVLECETHNIDEDAVLPIKATYHDVELKPTQWVVDDETVCKVEYDAGTNTHKLTALAPGHTKITARLPKYGYKDAEFEVEIASFSKLNFSNVHQTWEVYQADDGSTVTSKTRGKVWLPNQFFDEQSKTWNDVTGLYYEDSTVGAEKGAFENNTGITSVTIAEKNTNISQNAFNGCTNLNKVEFNDKNTVTEIQDFAFANCPNLVNVILPTNNKNPQLQKIGSGAFGCNTQGSLASIDLSGQTALTHIQLSAFLNQSKLTNITIPENVSFIGSSAFSGCTSLKHVTVNSNAIANLDKDDEACSQSGSTLLYDFAETIDINTDTVTLQDNSFVKTYYPTHSESPEAGYERYSVTKYLNLTTYTQNIDYTLGQTGKNSYPIKAKYKDKDDVKILAYASDLDGNPTDLVSIAYTDNVPYITVNNQNKYGLAKITVTYDDPKYSYAIESATFNIEVADYDKVTLADNVISKNDNSSGVIHFPTYNYKTPGEEPIEVNTIADSGFAGCTNLTGFVFNQIKQNITVIPSSAFASCGLTSVSIPEGVVTIGSNAFSICPNIQTIEIAKSVETIGSNAFMLTNDYTGALTSLTFAEDSKLDTIGANAFSYHKEATFNTISMPAKTKTVDTNAFFRCDSIKTTYINSQELADITDTSHTLYYHNGAYSNVYLKQGITPADGSVLEQYFVERSSTEPGYVKYAKVKGITLILTKFTKDYQIDPTTGKSEAINIDGWQIKVTDTQSPTEESVVDVTADMVEIVYTSADHSEETTFKSGSAAVGYQFTRDDLTDEANKQFYVKIKYKSYATTREWFNVWYLNSITIDDPESMAQTYESGDGFTAPSSPYIIGQAKSGPKSQEYSPLDTSKYPLSYEYYDEDQSKWIEIDSSTKFYNNAALRSDDKEVKIRPFVKEGTNKVECTNSYTAKIKSAYYSAVTAANMTKTSYLQGDKIDLDGLTLTGTVSDSSTTISTDIDLENDSHVYFTLNDYSSSAEEYSYETIQNYELKNKGTTILYVHYKNDGRTGLTKSDVYDRIDLTVSESYKSIEVTTEPTQIVYKDKLDDFDPTNMVVTATNYDDEEVPLSIYDENLSFWIGETEVKEKEAITGEKGANTLTVRYDNDEKVVSGPLEDTFTIYIIKLNTSLDWVSQPALLTYSQKDARKLTVYGGIIKATWADDAGHSEYQQVVLEDSYQDVTYQIGEGEEFTGDEMPTIDTNYSIGKHTVKLTLKPTEWESGVSTSFEITVTA